MSEDFSLADAPIDTTGVADSSLNPADHDWAAWLAGVRPTRRSVKLHPHADVIARMEQIVDEVNDAPDGANVDALIDEFEELKARFNDTRWVTVEARSHEWIRNFRTEWARKNEIPLDPDGDPIAYEDAVALNMAELAEQLVDDISVAQLRALYEANEPEYSKLINLMVDVNSMVAQSAKVLDVDFSWRRSVSPRKGRRSSKR